LFRIVDSLAQPASDAKDSDTLKIDHLEINENSMSISWKGRELSLTLTEFWLIESMARHPGHVKTYENMMQITRQSYVERNTINGYIRRIRNKFKEIDADFKNIQTVFGVGYKWNISK
jgi:two-component system OmpR family response regulator